MRSTLSEGVFNFGWGEYPTPKAIGISGSGSVKSSHKDGEQSVSSSGKERERVREGERVKEGERERDKCNSSLPLSPSSHTAPATPSPLTPLSPSGYHTGNNYNINNHNNNDINNNNKSNSNHQVGYNTSSSNSSNSNNNYSTIVSSMHGSRVPNALEVAVTAAFGRGEEEDNEQNMTVGGGSSIKSESWTGNSTISDKSSLTNTGSVWHVTESAHRLRSDDRNAPIATSSSTTTASNLVKPNLSSSDDAPQLQLQHQPNSLESSPGSCYGPVPVLSSNAEQPILGECCTDTFLRCTSDEKHSGSKGVKEKEKEKEVVENRGDERKDIEKTKEKKNSDDDLSESESPYSSLPITAISTSQTSDSSMNIASGITDGDTAQIISDKKGKGNTKNEGKNESDLEGKSAGNVSSISWQGSKEKATTSLGLSVFDTVYSLMKSNFS